MTILRQACGQRNLRLFARESFSQARHDGQNACATPVGQSRRRWISWLRRSGSTARGTLCGARARRRRTVAKGAQPALAGQTGVSQCRYGEADAGTGSYGRLRPSVAPGRSIMEFCLAALSTFVMEI
jgi:hypothetical protein